MRLFQEKADVGDEGSSRSVPQTRRRRALRHRRGEFARNALLSARNASGLATHSSLLGLQGLRIGGVTHEPANTGYAIAMSALSPKADGSVVNSACPPEGDYTQT